MSRTTLQRRLTLGVRHALRLDRARFLGWLRWLGTSYLALAITFWILPGDQTQNATALLAIVLVVGALGIALRPLLLTLIVAVGSLGIFLVGAIVQAVILDVALAITPGAYPNSFPDVLVASWIAAGIIAAVNWVLDAGSEDDYLAQVLGRAVRVSARHGSDGKGLLIVQIDGLAAPVLRGAVTAGTVPTLSRWLRTGHYVSHRWHTGLPSTTPGGQSVLLHRDVTAVPSFRWYEKDPAGGDGRLLVANRPRDAAVIEARMSDGRGLLADGGVSVSNLFSGDAPTKVLTMSDARLPARNTPGLANFAVSGNGFLRSVLLFLGEVLTELQQSRRQRRRDVTPRVARRGAFIALRAVSTVLLRNINVAVVAEQMARGTPVIFVDFVDYDEVAHHAGPTRPESLRTLDGLDRVLAALEQIATEVRTDYEIVVLSDHGQAQGATFSQLYGHTLNEVVQELAGTEDDPHENVDSAPAEQWGAANVLLTGAARKGTITAGATEKLLRHRTEREDDDVAVILGRGKKPITHPRFAAPVVAASGSLAHVYLPDVPGRLDRAVVEQRVPGLIAGLAAHPGIGVVLVRDGDGLTAVGGGGERRIVGDLTLGGHGVDPLLPYGVRAAADLTDLDRRDHVGDLVLLGAFDPETEEVTAFEELVGSHGGLGGAQTEAVLLHPAGWWHRTTVDPADGGRAAPMTGTEVHDLLVDRLRALGLRPGDAEAGGRRDAAGDEVTRSDPDPEPEPARTAGSRP
ncbi:alkaline phosphatase family protein [Jatrophihabitans sp. YIM 134969]